MKKLLFIFVLLLVGCDKYTVYYTYSREWRDKTDAWVEETRKNCTHIGTSMDRGHSNLYYINDILKCPDETIRIIPSER